MAKAKPSARMLTPRGRSPVRHLLSFPHVAAIHQVVTQVVYRAISRGDLPAWLVDNIYLVPAAACAAWMPGGGRTRWPGEETESQTRP